jgi:hypothetical protein
MSNSRALSKHGEGPSRELDHGPDGLLPGTERRRDAVSPRKRKPKRSDNRGNKKPSNAGPRYRAKDVKGVTVELGRMHLVDNGGAVYSNNIYQHLLHSSIKRCWDESHKLTRPVIGWYEKYYKIPGTGYKGAKPLIGVKNQRIFGKPVHNDGGPLRIIECQVNPVTNDEIQGIGTYYGSDYRPYGFAERYIGGFVPANWNHGYSRVDFNEAGFSGPLGSGYEPALPYGAEVYNKMRPRITDFDAMQGIGQNLYELPSQLATTSKGFSQAYRSMRGSSSAAKELFMPENLASQFLNEQFGWAPFVGDLLSLHRAYSRQTKRFKEISSQNNRWNRRKRTLFNIEEQSPITTIDDFAGNCYPPLLSGFYRSSGTFVTSKLYTVTKRKVWGVGAFKFYAPEFDSMNRASEGKYGEIMRAVHYYGVQVSPSAVWELMPWSWLVDWFTNAGNVIDNITAQVFDRLMSRYAYVMCLSNKFAFNQTTIHLKAGDIQCNWVQKIVSKRREEASPYGFGLTSGDLTVRQQLILAAVGLTRK